MTTRSAPVYRWRQHAAHGEHSAVWGPTKVGTLTQAPGRWEFYFDEQYLALGLDAWELDPAWLRLKQRSAFVFQGEVPPGVFVDVALSGWSLDIAKSALGSSVTEWGWWERMTLAPLDGFGALAVGELHLKPDLEATQLSALGKVTKRGLADIAIDTSSGAMGGERPKISASIPAAGGRPARHVIVKFSGPKDAPDAVVAEATALSLAKNSGLDVPWHEVVQANGIPALCIERFDRPGDGSWVHCVSSATALGIPYGSDPQDKRRNYVALRSKLKRPGDNVELFRRIVLNAVVGNSDDHPWNHSLRQVGLGQWELSPLYDVMPFLHRLPEPSFSMAIVKANLRQGSIANLIRSGREIGGFGQEEARAEIDRISQVVKTQWRAAFAAHAKGLADADIERWVGTFEGYKGLSDLSFD